MGSMAVWTAVAALSWPSASVHALGSQGAPEILSLSRSAVQPGDRVVIQGHGLGSSPGCVLVSGLQVKAEVWTDTAVRFQVPPEAASGTLRVRRADGQRSAPLPFTVNHPLPQGQFPPSGFKLEDTGLWGAAFLVETDGTHLYGVCGLETLVTYQIQPGQPHRFCSRLYLNQRVGDLRLVGDHLFCAGDHGLMVFRCADLQSGPARPVAAVTGFSCLSVDAQPDPSGELEGHIVALTEYAPRWGSDQLRVLLYQFAHEELRLLGVFARAVPAQERQFAVALGPRFRKAYVSGAESLLGTNQYILELTLEDLKAPALLHREPTPKFLTFDMEAKGAVLWAGLVGGGFELFRAYMLRPGANHLQWRRTIRGKWSPGRATRVKILDNAVTVGCAWAGQRPDIFLMDTVGAGSTPLASMNSLDWAFDVAGAPDPKTPGTGKIFVADEWGGFLTLRYNRAAADPLSHEPDYQWTPAASMTEGLHLTADRIYIAGRGAGPWSADRFHLTNESQWRHVPFDWSLAEPQPHPVSALATRRDPEAGLLIAALGHEKAMAWGQKIIGLLYRETPSDIELLAASEEIDPPGLWSQGVSVVWARPDLVFMTTGSDGFRAYVIDPRVPSIHLHEQCRTSGLDTNTFGPQQLTTSMKRFTLGSQDLLVVGSRPNGLSSAPTLHLYRVSYPQGPPSRDQPRAPLQVVKSAALECLKFKTVHRLDVHPAGWIALATAQGIAILHRSWVQRLNDMPDWQAWNHICMPTSALAPWWDVSWSKEFKDVGFADEHTLYAVKNPQGVWRIRLEPDAANLTVRALATSYYPGVECGLNYARLLHGWADANVPTLHNPYALAVAGDTVYVTGWSGKVRRLRFEAEEGVKLLQLRWQANEAQIEFASPLGSRNYTVESRASVERGNWTPIEPVAIRQLAPTRFVARFPASAAARQFYRLRIRP